MQLFDFACLTLVMAFNLLLCPHLSSCDQHHVTLLPSSDTPCHVKTCFTLKQFALNVAHNSSSYSELLILNLMPGNHTIDSKLVIEDIQELIMISNDTMAWINCESTADLMSISTPSVEIRNLVFLGCKINLNSVANLTIDECTFLSHNWNTAMLQVNKSTAIIIESSFIASNDAQICKNGSDHSNDCEAMIVSHTSNVSICTSTFTGKRGRALFAISSKIDITDSTLCNSSTTPLVNHMALIASRNSILQMKSTTIINNERQVIMFARYSSITITDSSFISNYGAFYAGKSNISFDNTSISGNSGSFSMILVKAHGNITNGNISNNIGSFVIRNTYLKFNGSNVFADCVQRYNKTKENCSQAQGTITSIHSILDFYGRTMFVDNHSEKSGGAIHALGSKIFVYGNLTIANNFAEDSGGGAYLYLTQLVCFGNCTISGNRANNTGGGIHAISTQIFLRSHSVRNFRPLTRSHCKCSLLIIADNKATRGGGLYSEMNSRISGLDSVDYHYSISFVRNNGTLGGAIFIEDKTYSGTCGSTSSSHYLTKTACFLQTYYDDSHPRIQSTKHITFVSNSADKGSILYGGLLDRCTVDRLADVYMQTDCSHLIDGLTYFMNESGLTSESKNDISSDAVRVCFCQAKPNCSYKPPTISVMKGEEFNVSVIAVDQVDQPVEATISVALSSKYTLAEGQLQQNVTLNCTNLTFKISSLYDSINLSLYAETGPCRSGGISVNTVKVNFKTCTCPIGFQVSTEETKCECECLQELQPCMSASKSQPYLLQRQDNCWVGYDVNKGYLIYPNCPYDYCESKLDMSINLSDPNGADVQCAFNRSGFLCGKCKAGFSLSIGTTHCIKCPKHWRGILITYIVAAAFSGIVIVAVIFVFNLTVASGTINGLIFYANIVLANGRTFLPFVNPNFFTVFIALLNSELGLERCLYDGVDAYAKTWLALLFPLYLIVLVVIIMITSKHSTKCAYLIGKRNPVAMLATLILLSYTSIIRKVIDIFSSATLRYADGSRDKFWRLDASVRYFQGKHIPLFLMAMFLTVIGLIYTVLLFSWQWLLRVPDKKMFSWIRNTKLNSFMDAYLAPYKQQYRYWTGFLLFARIVINFMLAVNESGDDQYNLLTVGIVTTIVLLLKAYLGDKVYKNSALDYLECTFYFNLLIFTLASFYSLSHRKCLKASAYVSISITLVVFLGILFYHVHLSLNKFTWYSKLKSKFLRTMKLIDKSINSDFNYGIANIGHKPTSTEVGMSDSLEESTGETSMNDMSENGTPGNRLGIPQRKQRFRVSIKSYNSLYLRESLLH